MIVGIKVNVALLCGALMMVILMVDRGEALPTTMEKMTVSRMRMADLESSATGYVYNSQRGHPGSYVQYTNHGSNRYYDAPAPIQYVTYRKPGVILHPEPNVVAPLRPGYVVPLLQAPKQPALAPYYVDGSHHHNPHHVELHDDGDSDEDDDDEDNDSHEDDDHHEEHGAGDDYNAEEHSSGGEKGEEGYGSHHEFAHGDKGEHNKDNHEGHYSEEGGNKKSHHENAGHYSDHDEAEKGDDGESYGQEAYHKNGHKTSGFHNVYRKDEYKKDTDFYDDNHKSGHYDKHSSHDAHHASADGGYKKGGHHDSGYGEHEQGKAGHFDKGHEHSQHNGYKSEKGDDSYHKNHADYASKNGAKRNKEYGYDNGHL